MEALAILFVFAVALVVFVVTWFGNANGAENAAAKLEQLEQYRAVLQKKTRRGQREGWDEIMMDQIAGRLEEVERRIARAANQS